jgi:hypothetical protein
MRTKILFFAICLSIALFSCSDEQDYFPNDTNNNVVEEKANEILTFNSKEAFLEMLNPSVGYGVRSTELTSPLGLGNSLYDNEEYENFYSIYVPDERFAKLLNPDGGIIVADTIYRITPNGTYYAHASLKVDFDNAIESNGVFLDGIQIDEKLYQISEGIYRYDTFYYVRENESFYGYDEDGYNYDDFDGIYDAEYAEGAQLRSVPANPPFNSFRPFVGTTKTTVLNWLSRNILGWETSAHQFTFANGNRRMKGEFGTKNYVFYTAAHVKGWQDKKNWIGWSGLEAHEMRIGWRNVLIAIPVYSIPTTPFPAGMLHTPQWTLLPGSATGRHMYTRAFTAPNGTLSQFERAAIQGAPSMFNLLRTWYGGNLSQSEWDKLQAAIIFTNTHIIQFVKDDYIDDYNAKKLQYTFVDSSQFQITLNPNSFNFSGNTTVQNVTQILKMLAETTKHKSPTVHAGQVYIASKFSTEWQGMIIEAKR